MRLDSSGLTSTLNGLKLEILKLGPTGVGCSTVLRTVYSVLCIPAVGPQSRQDEIPL